MVEELWWCDLELLQQTKLNCLISNILLLSLIDSVLTPSSRGGEGLSGSPSAIRPAEGVRTMSELVGCFERIILTLELLRSLTHYC
ncbi:hypothetical protein Leryth_024408 [Lithospermum erythrorhizon]|nr:hypothetical protein Leryth_024408 [Lithospermum erythrorhizon]